VERLLAALVATYGFLLSRSATENIRRVHEQAQAGSSEAQAHFTQTRYARVLGPWNSDLGMLFYSAVALAALTGLIHRRRVLGFLLLGSGASLAMSLYLLWALLVRLRVWCAICMRAHLVNATLFTMILRLWRRDSASKQS
jgi:uncharacterized membrane protein